MMRPTDLGLLRLLTDEVPIVLDLDEERGHLPARVDLGADEGQLLVWHSRRARTRPRGPDAELRDVGRWLAERGIRMAPDDRYAVSTSGSDLRVVWPLGAKGLARWEVRTGLVGQGRFGGVKRPIVRVLGDRIAARMRSGTLVRVERPHAR